MYKSTVVFDGSGDQRIDDPARGTQPIGFRCLAQLSGSTTAEEAYADAQATYVIWNSAGVSNPSLIATKVGLVTIDGPSYFQLSGNTPKMTGGLVGQTYIFQIVEAGDNINVADSFFAGLGPNPPTPTTPEVTSTAELELLLTAPAPTDDTDGADFSTGNAIQLTVVAQVASTLLATGFLRAWGFFLGVWVRMPELDYDLSALELGNVAITFDAILAAMGGTATVGFRIAWRPDGMTETGAGTTVSLEYRVTTPQVPSQTLADGADPEGALDLDAATTNPPTSEADGVDLSGINAVQMQVSAPASNLIDSAGGLAAFYLPPGDTVWSRIVDWDLDLDPANLPSYEGDEQVVLFFPFAIDVPAGRLAYRPKDMTLTGVGTTVDLDYRLATAGSAAVVPTPTTEIGLATPDGAVPTLPSQGVSLTDVVAVRVTVKTTNGTDLITAVGKLAAYLYVTVGVTSYWSRAPLLDLAITEAGQVSLSFGDLVIGVPSGRLAFRPKDMVLNPPGGTVDITYQPAE